MKKLFKMVLENIKEEKGAFFSSLVSFVLIFTLTNIVVFGVLNADAYRLKQETSNQVILYLKETGAEEKEKLQTELLKLDGVASLRYVSKDVALKALELDLNVDLTGQPNPLEDAFFVYLTRNVNIDDLSNKLNSMDNFTEIDLRSKVITQNVEFSHSLDSAVTYSVAFLGVFFLIIIYSISVLSIKSRKREIHANLYRGVKPNLIKTSFFIESVIAIAISMLVSILFYSRIRAFIIALISKLTNKIVFTSMSKEIGVISLIFVATIIFSLIINYFSLNGYYNLAYYVKEAKEDKEKDLELEKEVLQNQMNENMEVEEDEEDEFADLREE